MTIRKKSIEIQPPNDISAYKNVMKVFLAGSIDMNKAVRWQEKVINSLAKEEIAFLNPRRDDFNIELEQSIHCEAFVEQVEWELNALQESDVILFFFDPSGKAPISLLELGLFARDKTKKIFVYCPEGYWRKGNVDIVCRKFNIEQIVAKTEEKFYTNFAIELINQKLVWLQKNK